MRAGTMLSSCIQHMCCAESQRRQVVVAQFYAVVTTSTRSQLACTTVGTATCLHLLAAHLWAAAANCADRASYRAQGGSVLWLPCICVLSGFCRCPGARSLLRGAWAQRLEPPWAWSRPFRIVATHYSGSTYESDACLKSAARAFVAAHPAR